MCAWQTPRGDDDPRLEGGSGVFERGGRKAPEIAEEQVKELYAKIGELASAVEIDVSRFLAGQPAELAGVAIGSFRDPRAPRTLWFLASAMTGGLMRKADKSQLLETVGETTVLIEPLSDLLVDWPRKHDDHVAARWHAPEAEGLPAAQRLGPWYRGLLAQWGILAEALLTACLQVVAHRCGDPDKVGCVEGESEWMCAAEAGRSLTMRPDRLVEAARSGALNGAQSRSGTGCRHTVVRAGDAVAIRRERRRFNGKCRGTHGPQSIEKAVRTAS